MTINDTLMLILFAGVLASFATGAAGALLWARWVRASRLVGHSFALLGSLFALGLGLAGLLGGALNLSVPEILPVGGVGLGVDQLSAFFILVIAVAAVPSACRGRKQTQVRGHLVPSATLRTRIQKGTGIASTVNEVMSIKVRKA